MVVVRRFGSEQSLSGLGRCMGQSLSIWPELKHGLEVGPLHNYKHTFFHTILIISFFLIIQNKKGTLNMWDLGLIEN